MGSWVTCTRSLNSRNLLGLVSVPKLDGFVNAGGGAGGGHSAEHALVRVDVRLDGGVTAGVEDLPAHDLGNRGGGLLLQVLSLLDGWVEDTEEASVSASAEALSFCEKSSTDRRSRSGG